MNLYEFCKKDKKIDSLYWMRDIYNELWYVRWQYREIGDINITKTKFPEVFMMRDKELISWGEFDFAGSLFVAKETIVKYDMKETLNGLMDDMELAKLMIILRDTYRKKKLYEKADKVKDDIKALKHFNIYIEDRK